MPKYQEIGGEIYVEGGGGPNMLPLSRWSDSQKADWLKARCRSVLIHFDEPGGNTGYYLTRQDGATRQYLTKIIDGFSEALTAAVVFVAKEQMVKARRISLPSRRLSHAFPPPQLCYNLAELFATVEAVGATPGSVKLPEEGEPDYLGMITLLGNEDHEDMVVEVRGGSHEEAMVNAIAEWNKRYA